MSRTAGCAAIALATGATCVGAASVNAATPFPGRGAPTAAMAKERAPSPPAREPNISGCGIAAPAANRPGLPALGRLCADGWMPLAGGAADIYAITVHVVGAATVRVVGVRGYSYCSKNGACNYDDGYPANLVHRVGPGVVDLRHVSRTLWRAVAPGGGPQLIVYDALWDAGYVIAVRACDRDGCASNSYRFLTPIATRRL